ncbi:MAG: hypothetical protein ACODAC_11010 [Pseudomonadota bacterium]
MTYDELAEDVARTGDTFRTYGALLGCTMFFSIAMVIDRSMAGVTASAALWALLLAFQYVAFEEIRRRAVARLHRSLLAWFRRGPGAGGARVIDTTPLSISYEHFGHRKRAAIAFLWSRIELETGPLEPAGASRAS